MNSRSRRTLFAASLLVVVGAAACAGSSERAGSSPGEVAPPSSTEPPPAVEPPPSTAPPPRTGPSSFEWPTPKGWRSETIPFPLGFAPDLAYRGVEEIRFAPRFFEPEADTYFSYSFAWLLDDPPAFDAPRLATDLEHYFSGLARSVAPARFDAKAHHARIDLAQGGRYRGAVDTVDAFGDGRALTLLLDGEEVMCGSRRGVILSLSPRPAADAVWSEVTAQRRTFRCAM